MPPGVGQTPELESNPQATWFFAMQPHLPLSAGFGAQTLLSAQPPPQTAEPVTSRQGVSTVIGVHAHVVPLL